jgi:hypothetical protein
MQSTKRTIVVAMRAALAAVLALVVFPGTHLAHGQEGRGEGAENMGNGSQCSDRTLHGDYGFAIGGTVFAGPASLLLRGVAMTHFDGRGGLTQVDFTTLNGAPASPDWRPATGTYTVNEDCTGRAEIVPATGPALQLRLVVFDRGRQVATVVVGNATGSLGTKVR